MKIKENKNRQERHIDVANNNNNNTLQLIAKIELHKSNNDSSIILEV